MTKARQDLEMTLKAFEMGKKAAKGTDEVAFLVNARGVAETIRKMEMLPEDNALTDFQVGSYCWALYAIASKSADGDEARQALSRLVCAYRKRIDSPQFWGAPKNKDFGKVLFRSVVLQTYQVVKHANEGTGETFLKAIGVPFLEILSLRAEVFLDADAFRKDPVTDVQRAEMERHAGKKIRMKFWPSTAEKAFGLMNRILKFLPGATPSPELVAFLAKNVSQGEWLGYYCAKAHVRVGEYEKARKLIVAMLRRKATEGWLWADLADACRDCQGLAVSCLAKSLLCPNRDPQIAEGMARKEQALLGRLLSALGRSPAPPDLKDPFYRQEAAKAELFVFGENRAPSGQAIMFSGKLSKRTGNAFGFVNDAKVGSVFIPPCFAEKHANGDLIKGKARKKEDKKKNRLNWCMISAL